MLCGKTGGVADTEGGETMPSAQGHNSPQAAKLSGQAVQNWNLLRLLPLIIGDRVKDTADDVWQLTLQLKDIVDLICAQKISVSQVAYLDILIQEYLESRKALFPESNLKPKHHYLRHYPALILKFGPLIRVWTMCFESKHSYFKRCARNLKNFKNLCLTLSERHQIFQAYLSAGPMGQVVLQVKDGSPFYSALYSKAIQDAVRPFDFTEINTKVTLEMLYKGTSYKKGQFLVTGNMDSFSPDEVKTLMKSTYYSQRKETNQGTDLQILMEEWPFLFQEIGMAIHFQELTGVALKETFLASVEKKGKRLLDFMQTICADKSKQVLQAVKKLKILRGQLEGCSEDVKDMVLLLLSYFNEKEENLFHYVEDTCLAEEVQVENLPVTPCIIVCGTSCYASRQFMLAIDRKVVNDHISTFIAAVCLMLGSYYCFNIHCPVDLGSTLEFLQRCFLNINPEKGTKVESKKHKKQLSVNPRVLTLIADLSDHEWRETC
ncbi:hypothetical protein N1851_022919 [Merluccius polli]|uniref:Uncharacterized protein n=1 Tax=Merluccius polli TaxID=89951 RepID=A0AA47NWS1_MERPO|nr:hypothetical protein N1851_022919 [Merluccius polli]